MTSTINHWQLKMRFYSLLLMASALTVFPFDARSQEWHPTSVELHERGHGWLITGEQGLMLYTYTRDQEPGKSECNEACAERWPPFTALADAEVQGDWSTLVREDGASQWAFRGQPLYYYSNDTLPGEKNGDDLNQQWYAALKPIKIPPGIEVMKKEFGQIFVDPNKMSLYTSVDDTPTTSACDASCAMTWQPIEAPMMATMQVGDWTTIERHDGRRQWAYKGEPLYRYDGDVLPDDANGDGIDNWQLAVIEPPPSHPNWVTYQESGGGTILADAQYRTIYVFRFGFVQRVRNPLRPQDGFERPQDWDPVLAEAGAQKTGDWSLMDREDGMRQWVYKGQRVFRNKNDKNPGDLNGIRSMDSVWRTITKNGRPMAGAR